MSRAAATLQSERETDRKTRPDLPVRVNPYRRTEMSSLDVKIVVLGPAGVGKTSIICRYCNGTFIDETLSTIGAGFFTNTKVVDHVEITMMLWDTAGEERFRSVAPSLLRGANGVVLTYDLGSLASFRELDAYMGMFVDTCAFDRENAPVLLLGNKCDLDTRDVPEEVVSEWMARNNVNLHFEVSAKEGTNIEEGFGALLEVFVKHIGEAGVELMQLSTLKPADGGSKRCC